MPSPYWSRLALILPALLECAAVPAARGEVTLPGIFGDHMVLQQGAKLPVWGWAAAGEKITVTLASRTATTAAGADGKWRVDLAQVARTSKPQVLTVAGSNTLTCQDVLVGDVWIASGQSNMEFGIQTDSRAAESIAKADDPQLRMFFVPWATALEPKPDIAADKHGDSLNGKWQVCTPQMMATSAWAWHGFSAIGYYFAREIRHATGGPVGMIATYKGGTPAQAWTSLTGLRRDPALAHYLSDHDQVVAGLAKASEDYPALASNYQANLKRWNAESGPAYHEAMARWKTANDQAQASGQAPPPVPQPATPQPRAPRPPDGGFSVPGTLFNAMVAPLIPYGIKGVIWYQGESNGDKPADAVEYATLFPRMIADWRQQWAAGDFPFLFVQLANYKKPALTPAEGNWPWVRDAQLRTLALPNTGMAVAVDIGDANDIHPKDKLDVGHRLALAARRVAYGEKIVHAGPTYEAMAVQGNAIRLSFTSRATGLTLGVPPWTPTGTPPPAPTELKGFGIAGADRQFVWARAVIDSATVVVSSPAVPHPVAVRYDWADNPSGNLYNKDGLPASPFRTDAWPLTLATTPIAPN